MKRLALLSTLFLFVPACASEDVGDDAIEASEEALTTTRVDCGSQGRYRECDAGGVVTRVRLVRQLSSATCIEGSSWGYERGEDYVWVDRGCRGQFEVTLRGVGGGSPQPPPPSYEGALRNQGTGQCIEATEPLQLVSCDPSNPRQRWFWNSAGLLSNIGTGKCLDGFDGSGNIHPYLFDCSTANRWQRWERLANGQFRNAGTGKCLDGFNGDGNTRPYFFTCAGGNLYQQWKAQ